MTESKNLAPLISVIVPVYNVAEYLPECVDSICNQSYKNLEIILVDDGSTDNSGKICDEYAKKDLRIKVIHKENGGLSDARNTGIEIAQGEWISFVDSDDLISNHMYEKMYEAGLIYSASLVCCQSTQDYKNINTISGDSEIKVMTDKTDMIRQMFNGGGTDNFFLPKII